MRLILDWERDFIIKKKIFKEKEEIEQKKLYTFQSKKQSKKRQEYRVK